MKKSLLSAKYTEHQGLNGTPYRQFEDKAVPMFRHDDPLRLKPQYVKEGHVDIFDCSDPKQLERWNEIADKMAKGHAALCSEKTIEDREKKSFIVYVRWVEWYLTDPNSAAIMNKKEESGNE